MGVFPKSRIRSNYPYKKRILTIKREALVPFILISRISSLEKMLNFCLLAPDVLAKLTWRASCICLHPRFSVPMKLQDWLRQWWQFSVMTLLVKLSCSSESVLSTLHCLTSFFLPSGLCKLRVTEQALKALGDEQNLPCVNSFSIFRQHWVWRLELPIRQDEQEAHNCTGTIS